MFQLRITMTLREVRSFYLTHSLLVLRTSATENHKNGQTLVLRRRAPWFSVLPAAPGIPRVLAAKLVIRCFARHTSLVFESTSAILTLIERNLLG